MRRSPFPDDAAVFRDSWGIPHLRAGSAHDLAFLQGWNAALDRSWQIETDRWHAEGRMSENLGADHLPWDRFARQSRLDDTARRCFDALDDETRSWCARYVDGVNTALHQGRRSGPGFEATRSSPSPWHEWTPLAVFLVNHVLFSTFPHKLFRAHAEATLGVELTGLLSMEAPVLSGSNAWAVHGSRTADGAPLIAGDPHRLLEAPGVYQQIRLSCPEFDVVGLAFPGVPGLPHFGHAGSVAWGITNAMADYQDLYREELCRATDGRWLARGPHGLDEVRHHTERILIRGEAAQDVEILETLRGPVISRTTGSTPDAPETALSLRVPARVEERLGFESLLPLLRSRTAQDVRDALGPWVEPVNSVLAADTGGTVLHFLAGRVPERNPANRRVPAPAWSAGHEWTGGSVPLPCRTVHDLAVSANDRAAAAGADIAFEFAAPHRARRIRELLETTWADAPLGVPEMERIQHDVRLGSLPGYRTALEQLGPTGLTDTARTLRRRLLDWDGEMTADSLDAAAFAVFRDALARLLADGPVFAPLGRATGHSPLFGPWLSAAARIGLALETLLTAEIPGLDIAAALRAALEQASHDDDERGWGDLHRLHALHRRPSPEASSSSATRLAGDGSCVLATDATPGVTHACVRGPAARYVWDLGARDNSRWVVPFGSAGNPEDPHFADQQPLWSAGELIPVVTDWALLTQEN
ncbi:penicillin acylase family protein [Arthrobacter sp. NPDC090010]|uniref:penicillin acylase family protein n=1 Tax=Arthrobacter sp. NPDC090010 TaxID=3363942 RepID=UPI0038065645